MLLRTLQCFYWILREKDRERDWELGLIFPKFSLNTISEALFQIATPSAGYSVLCPSLYRIFIEEGKDN